MNHEANNTIQADPLKSLAQGDPVAWIRCHPDGTLTREILHNDAVEQVRKDSGAWMPLDPRPAASPAATYSSTQATACAVCLQHKHTPLRIDAMGGYPNVTTNVSRDTKVFRTTK